MYPDGIFQNSRISVIMLPIAYFAYWMERSAVGFLIYFGIFVLIFVIIWITQLVMGRHNVRKMNEKLFRTKDNKNEWGITGFLKSYAIILQKHWKQGMYRSLLPLIPLWPCRHWWAGAGTLWTTNRGCERSAGHNRTAKDWQWVRVDWTGQWHTGLCEGDGQQENHIHQHICGLTPNIYVVTGKPDHQKIVV